MGCSSLSGTDGKGYISADGQVRVIDAPDRGEPLEVEGTSLQDEPLSITALRGKPVVVNLWYSACGPCRVEADDLAAAHDELGATAAFVGVNIRDTSPAVGRLFEEKRGVPYPSIYDPDGRVAAVVSGPIPSVQTLVDLVDGVAADG